MRDQVGTIFLLFRVALGYTTLCSFRCESAQTTALKRPARRLDMDVRRSYLAENPVLVFSLSIALLLGLFGIWWGWVECWNPDQMALQMLRSPSLHMLVPDNFLKPPFHSYLNLALSIMPLKGLEKVIHAITGSDLAFEKIGRAHV